MPSKTLKKALHAIKKKMKKIKMPSKKLKKALRAIKMKMKRQAKKQDISEQSAEGTSQSNDFQTTTSVQDRHHQVGVPDNARTEINILAGTQNVSVKNSQFIVVGHDQHNITNNYYGNQEKTRFVKLINPPLLNNSFYKTENDKHDVLQCPAPSQYFTGRKDILQKLSEIFAADAPPMLRVVTLVAKGGTGKTQVVLKFVSEQTSRFSNIWFFDATSKATLETDFKKLAKAADIGDGINDVKDLLGRNCKDSLLIFDSADDPDIYLNDYIPSCNHGNVIITSRLADTRHMASSGHDIGFNDLEKEDAIELLLQHAHEDKSATTYELGSSIVDTLECYALAISTAGAYIHTTPSCKLSDYLARFKKKQGELIKYRMKSLDSYQRTVFSAFQLSFEKLKSRTQCLLQICAFLHHKAIPIQLFQRAAAFDGEDLDPGEQPPAMAKMEEFLSLFEDDDSWEESVDELCQFSLASYDNGTKVLSLHSVIHACSHETVNVKDSEQDVAFLLIGRATPLGFVEADYQFRKQLWVHASYMAGKNMPTVHVQICVAQILRDAGMWAQVEQLEEQVVGLCKEVLGERHPSTLTSMSNLAWTYESRGKWEAAEQLGEQVVGLKKEVLGERHPHTLTSMSSLAFIYKSCGKLEAAEQLGEQVVGLSKEVLGECHPSTLTSMSNLASNYQSCGKWEAAEQLGEQVVGLSKEVLGERHPSTLTFMCNLSWTYNSCGKWEAAEQLGEQVVGLSKEVLGERHPSTLIPMSNLAMAYESCGKWEAAEQLGEQVVGLSKEVLGECHPTTLTSMSNLAWTYESRGKWEAAEQLGEQVVGLKKEVLGERHPSTLTSMSNLASTYMSLGKWEAAEQLGEQVVGLSKEVLGERHPSTLTSMSNFAWTYKSCGKWEAAEQLEEQVVGLSKEVLGEHHPNTLTFMSNLAWTYNSCGKLEAAEQLGEQVIGLKKEVLGERHPSTLTSMSNLASTYMSLGKWEAAEQLGEQVAGLRKEVLGECHPKTLASMNNLAWTYERHGKWEAAEQLGEQVVGLIKEVLGEHHPNTLTSMSNLASIYRSRGKWEAAEQLGEQVVGLRKEVLRERHPDTLTSMNNLALTYESCGKWEAAKQLREHWALLEQEEE
ncbi:hypothetical protein D9758_006875 [Tetrapyrgos nigripes]|uniref:TPR-like protein n=1 Tax=Tetrapyrgos nigripes TaxID=182062 RepID=A0A8H5GSM7_9AGAR|nr:hypothetical protein D9758_006875 [Tetrapyrgos nigripes]